MLVASVVFKLRLLIGMGKMQSHQAGSLFNHRNISFYTKYQSCPLCKKQTHESQNRSLLTAPAVALQTNVYKILRYRIKCQEGNVSFEVHKMTSLLCERKVVEFLKIRGIANYC